MFKDQIKAGVALLDEKLSGWEDLIELDRLNLGSGCMCILGQAEENYWTGILKLFPNAQSDEELYGLSIEHGFNVKNHADWEYAPLTQEWKQFILARREQKNESTSCNNA